MGSDLVPRNYPHANYPFRQNSHFLYYTGHALPGAALLIDPDGTETLYVPEVNLGDIVWTGPLPSPAEIAREAGIAHGKPVAELGEAVRQLDQQRVPIHFLEPFDAGMRNRLSEFLGLRPEGLAVRASLPLIEAVIHQRLHKGPEEIAEIEEALLVTASMHRAVMSVAAPGVSEEVLAGTVHSIGLVSGRQQAYIPIVTVHGEVLHNNGYPHTLQAGQLLLNDSAAESPRFYASDITRTIPVTGKFSSEQRAIYETVLRAQEAAIATIRPGIPYRDIHLKAARIMVDGLKEIGLMRGDTDAAVAAGTHACFFPHGLGHMLGLDVHDLEDLGEDRVGYAPGQTRSQQFGLAYLRLARPLEESHVLTVEPGIYFIPALIDQWSSAGTNKEFINFDKLDAWKSFGGIRIEDDVLVTKDGGQVLGPGIPKSVAMVEAVMAK